MRIIFYSFRNVKTPDAGDNIFKILYLCEKQTHVNCCENSSFLFGFKNYLLKFDKFLLTSRCVSGIPLSGSEIWMATEEIKNEI